MLTISVSYRDMADEFSSIRRLGQAREFFESFDWTNDALRDLESVNMNRTHTVTCGPKVKIVTGLLTLHT